MSMQELEPLPALLLTEERQDVVRRGRLLLVGRSHFMCSVWRKW